MYESPEREVNIGANKIDFFGLAGGAQFSPSQIIDMTPIEVNEHIAGTSIVSCYLSQIGVPQVVWFNNNNEVKTVKFKAIIKYI